MIDVRLTSAWIPASERIDHPERRRMRESDARVKWCAAGRRSGKTEDMLDYILLGHGPEDADGIPLHRGAITVGPEVRNPLFIIACPTFDMVRSIWWDRLKDRLPPWIIEGKPNETNLFVRLINGALVRCIGMDRPQRAEGNAIDGLVGDEYAYWREFAFERSLLPATSTRGRPPGWSVLSGKPFGRNHFYRSWRDAKDGGSAGDEASFHWTSKEIITAEEWEAQKKRLDPRSFAQEYEASFLTQTGRVYYSYDEDRHVRKVEWDPARPLYLTFDFNVSPGAACAIQYHEIDGRSIPCVIGEFYQQDDSNSRTMARYFASTYAGQKNSVLLHGDVGGNQRRTSSDAGTDWQIIREELEKVWRDVRFEVPNSAPPIIDSVNALNTLLLNGADEVGLVVDPSCEHTRLDLDGVVWKEKGDRDIDKSDMKRTHWSDALRYFADAAHPIDSPMTITY